jgi:hypothetical protein
VLLAGLSLYIHYLAFLMLIVYGAYALARTGYGLPEPPKERILATVAIAAAALPILPVLLRFHAERGLHYHVAKTPHIFDLEVALAPPNIILGPLGGLLIARLLIREFQFRTTAAPASLWVLLSHGAQFPPRCYCAVGRLGNQEHPARERTAAHHRERAGGRLVDLWVNPPSGYPSPGRGEL